MRRLTCLLAAALLLPPALLARTQAQAAKPAAPNVSPEREILDKYCITCHSATRNTAGLALDSADVDHAAGKPQIWEKVVRKLRGRMHPPAAVPQPDKGSAEALLSSLEAQLDGGDVANWAPPAAVSISDLELASRLAAFLWSGWPDDELLDLASSGRLKSPAVLEEQVRRMLKDRRSDAFLSDFFAQWLNLRNLATVVPNATLFPEFDDDLRQAMQHETELFLESQVREDHSVVDLFTADYSFLNDRIARHYGIPNVSGSQFRRVPLVDPMRFGLLGQASVLTVTSYANRTSPVLRAKFLLLNVLGDSIPPPPANVPPLPEVMQGSGRQRLEQHRRNPVCASCHAGMDPFGFALENFDPIGRWRTVDGAAPIDASGELADGTQFNDPAGFRLALVSERRDALVGTVAEKLLEYALERRLEYFDMPAARTIVREAAPDQRWSSLLVAVAKSTPFQMKRGGSVLLNRQRDDLERRANELKK